MGLLGWRWQATKEKSGRSCMSSLEKSLAKFKRSLDSGAFYEAQQLVKTVYYRLRSRKLLEESRDLLEEASCLQLEHAQVSIYHGYCESRHNQVLGSQAIRNTRG